MESGFLPSLFSSMMQRTNKDSADDFGYGPNRRNDDSDTGFNDYDYYRQGYYGATTPKTVATPVAKKLYYNDNHNDYNKFNKGIERDQDQGDYGDYYRG